MLYSKPVACAGVLTTIVAVFTAQVGATVIAAIGAAGGAGAYTVAGVDGDTQVISVVLLTVMLCDPTATVVKVAEAW